MHPAPEILIVGAGPAGLTAAIRLAREGVRVLVVEGADFAGAENWSGGVLHAEGLPEIIGRAIWDKAPKERRIVARALFLHDGMHAAGFEARANAGNDYGEAWTVLRPKFDRWLAARAIEAGATLLTGTSVTGLRTDGGRIVGVNTDRGPVEAQVVFIAEGDAAGLLAREGLERVASPHFAQGFKAVFRLDAREIERRFEVGPGEGVAQEWMLRDGKLAGRSVPLHITALLYTNRDTLSVGGVLPLGNLADAGVADHPHLLERVLATPGLAGYLQGAEQVAYGAKIIRAGGVTEMPSFVRDGLAVGGGGLGLGLEIPYPNFMGPAITSARCFAEAVLALRAAGKDYTRANLEAAYAGPLKKTDDYANAVLIRRWPAAIQGGPMLFDHLPALFGQLVDADELPEKQARGQARRALAMQVAHFRNLISQGVRMGLGMGPNLFTRAENVSPLDVRFLVSHHGERPNTPPGPRDPLLNLIAAMIGHFYGRRLPRFAQRLKYSWRALRYLPASVPSVLGLAGRAVLGGVHLAGDFIAYTWRREPLADFLLRPFHRHEQATQRNLDWAKSKATPATPVGWIAPLARSQPDTRHLSVPMQVGTAGARQLRNVCPAEVYVVAGRSGGVASQFENCIKCESCRVTVPGIDWNRLSRHRFAYRVPDDGRYGLDATAHAKLALPERAPLALSAAGKDAWSALYRELAARPAMVSVEWAANFAEALAAVPASPATAAYCTRFKDWLARGKFGWIENEIAALLNDAGVVTDIAKAVRTPAEHARRRRDRRRAARRVAWTVTRLKTLAVEPWSTADRKEFLGWIADERKTRSEFVEWLAAWSPGLAWIAANHYLAETFAGDSFGEKLAAPLWREADGLSNWMPGVAEHFVDARGRGHASGEVRAHGMGADGAHPVRREVDAGLAGSAPSAELAALSLALALGQARVLRERAREYAATRVQFRGELKDAEGREAIGKFGAIKAMLAAIERGTVLLERARDRTHDEAPSVLALVNAQMGPWMDAIPWMAGQIFGGMGFSEEEIFAPRYRDANLFSQWPAARELVTENPEFEERLLAGIVPQRPVIGRALVESARARRELAELPAPQAPPARHRTRGRRPLVWNPGKLHYRSGSFLNGQLLAPGEALAPEHYRRDPKLRRTRAEVLRLLRSGFRSPDPALSYGRWIDRQHGMPDADIDRLRAFNGFATVVPETFGGKGWNKAQYSVLSTLSMSIKDTSVGLLIMASTSIGTMPVILGLEKDLPKLREELGRCLDARADWDRLRADLDVLLAMLAHPEPKKFRAALEGFGRHIQAMFLFPGSTLKYLARHFLLAMQGAVETAKRRDLEKLASELTVLRRELDELEAGFRAELADLDPRRQAHERFLRFLGCGQISAFALTEPAAGSDTGGIQTRALLREAEAEPLGNGFWRFTPPGGSAARVLAEGARFVFDDRRPQYRLDDGSLGVLDDSGFDLGTQRGERRIRAGKTAHAFHDIGMVRERNGKQVYRYYELTGAKMWITNGSVADRYSLYAQSEAGELGLMLERRSEGLRIGPNENKLGQRASPTNELTFDRVRVSADQLIGYRGHGQVNALETLSVGRGGLVSGCSTLADRLLHDYVDVWRREPQLYALAQAEQERIATLSARLVGLMDRADLSQGDFRIEAALSKYLASEGLHRILKWFETLYGPGAAARELPIEKWRRDIRILNIYEGTNEVQRFLALKDLPSLLKDGVRRPTGDESFDRALEAFHDFAAPRLAKLGARVWTEPDRQLSWFPVVEWVAQLYVWGALLERLRLLESLDDPADREHRARLHEHIASQAQHVGALARRIRDDFTITGAHRHPADASLILACDLLNRTETKDETPVAVGALKGEWIAILRSRYELESGRLQWAGWHAADLAVLDRLLGWKDASPALSLQVVACAPAGLDDRIQRLRAAGAAVLHVVEPAGGFVDATAVAAVIRARWPTARRFVIGEAANAAADRAFAMQLSGLLRAAKLAETSALGATHHGLWVESANGVRRHLAAARAVVLAWERKPDGRSDRFSVRAWLKAIGERVEHIEPAATALHDPRPQPQPPAAGLPERFVDAAQLGNWLKDRFGAQAMREPEAAVHAGQAVLNAPSVWIAPPSALAQAGASRAPGLIRDLGGDWAALTWGGAVSPSIELVQPGLRGIWRLPEEETDVATLAGQLAPHLQKTARLVFDATQTALAAAVAAELGLPLLAGIVALRDGRVSVAAGDLLGERELPPHVVLVVDGAYRRMAGKAVAVGAGTKDTIELNLLPSSVQRRSTLARWLARAAGKPGGLASARFIVDVGLGVGNEALYKEYVPPLVAALSAAAGAPVEVGATRKITQELKLLPVDRQIGQTGVAVSPELVLALGISGAPQHMSWLGRDAVVIAINRDPEAPIFSWHRHNPGPRVVACVGDLADWVPGLIRCLAPGEGAQSK